MEYDFWESELQGIFQPLTGAKLHLQTQFPGCTEAVPDDLDVFQARAWAQALEDKAPTLKKRAKTLCRKHTTQGMFKLAEKFIRLRPGDMGEGKARADILRLEFPLVKDLPSSPLSNAALTWWRKTLAEERRSLREEAVNRSRTFRELYPGLGHFPYSMSESEWNEATKVAMKAAAADPAAIGPALHAFFKTSRRQREDALNRIKVEFPASKLPRGMPRNYVVHTLNTLLYQREQMACSSASSVSSLR
jgi:hypothetical protein